MRVACLHCDAATVREGLLNVLGAGITHVGRASYPARLGTVLAFHAALTVEEAVHEHSVEVRVIGPGAERLYEALATISPGDRATLRPNEEVIAALAFPMQMVPLPQAGEHFIEVQVDTNPMLTLRFQATELAD